MSINLKKILIIKNSVQASKAEWLILHDLTNTADRIKRATIVR